MDNTTKIVITGHVDHGKSTLIGRLLYDTNSLPEEAMRSLDTQDAVGKFASVLDFLDEEREQNITIETAQLPFHTAKRNYIIIDAPGHKEYTQNMVTGSSEADIAVIVVAANDGVQEQTRRHAYLLSLLGMTDVVVVVNKMDMVAHSEKIYSFIVSELTEYFQSIGLTCSAYIPISAFLGENLLTSSEYLPWYRGKSLLGTLDEYRTRELDQSPSVVFPVQDVYGERIVGRIESGTIRAGDILMIANTDEAITIQEIHTWKEHCVSAQMGESVGMLVDQEAVRGDILVSPDAHVPYGTSVRGVIFWLHKGPFSRELSLTLQITTQETPCLISRIHRVIDSSTLIEVTHSDETILHTEVAEVTIEVQFPIVHQQFRITPSLGRFVLLHDGEIVAGGIIR